MKLKLQSNKEINTLQIFVSMIKESLSKKLEITKTGTIEHYSLQAEEELIDDLNRTLSKKIIDRKEKAAITLLKATAFLIAVKYNNTAELPEWNANAMLQQTNSIYKQFINHQLCQKK